MAHRCIIRGHLRSAPGRWPVGDAARSRADGGGAAPEPRQWATWDCGPLCDWMLGQLGLPDDKADAAGRAGAAAEPAAAEPVAASAAPGRAELRINDVTITEAGRDLELISAGHLGRGPARRSTAPCPPALHRARRASGPAAAAGGRMVPPLGRAGLEPARNR